MPGKRPAVCILIENLTVPFDPRVWHAAPKGSGFDESYETLEGIEIYHHCIWEASRPCATNSRRGRAGRWELSSG